MRGDRGVLAMFQSWPLQPLFVPPQIPTLSQSPSHRSFTYNIMNMVDSKDITYVYHCLLDFVGNVLNLGLGQRQSSSKVGL